MCTVFVLCKFRNKNISSYESECSVVLSSASDLSALGPNSTRYEEIEEYIIRRQFTWK